MNEREIFIEALHKTAVDQRAFLDKVCGTTGEIRERIDALLVEATDLDDFLESPLSISRLRSSGRIGEQIGPYRLTDEIGDGGMGTVYRAEQTHPFRRQVAIKIVKYASGATQIVSRFEVERRALAVMDHPNIARVFDGGTTSDGYPYFVMELIDGPSIIRYCDRHNLDLNDRLRLLVDVCRAVQHAHQKGIIHRDLKPSNILVAMVDNHPVPKVIDFGVAKAIGEDHSDWTSGTHFGQIIGTPEYMSPEQTQQAYDVDTRADIYSLGVITYQLLTGTTPLGKIATRATDYSEVLKIIRDVEPTRPSALKGRIQSTKPGETTSAKGNSFRRDLGEELDWIVMKCLEKDRARRYSTVDMLARDIQRYLSGDPVEARPISNLYRFKKLIRRHSVAAFGLTAALILLVAGFVATATQAVRAMRAEEQLRNESALVRNERDRALSAERKADRERQTAEHARFDEESHRRVAEQLNERSKHQSYSAQINLAFRAWKDGNISRSLVLLEGLRPRFDEPDPRTFEWYFLWRACQQGLIARWEAEPGQITNMHFLDDDRSMVIAGWDGWRIWDINLEQNSFQQRVRCGAGNTWALAVSPDRHTIASGTTLTDPLSVYFWDLGKTAVRPSRRESIVAVRGLAYSGDGQWLAGVGGNGLTVWNADPQQGERILLKISCHAVAFSQSRDLLAAGSDDGKIHIWRINQGEFEAQHAFQGHDDLVGCVVFSPDGRLLASSSRDAKIWSLDDGQSLAVPLPGSSIVPSVDFSPDGTLLAIASEDRIARVWHLSDKKIVETYPHDSPLSVVRFSPSGQLLATATHDGLVQLWNSDHFASVTKIDHGAEVVNASVLPDGKRLMTVGRASTRVWSIEKNPRVAQEGDSWSGEDSRLTSDRSLIGTLTGQRIEIRNSETLAKVCDFALTKPATRVELSNTGNVLAAWQHLNNQSGLLELYQLPSGVHLRSEEQISRDFVGLLCLAFDQEGTRFAVGYQLWWAVVRDLSTNHQQLLLTHDRSTLTGVTAVVFSKNGGLIATGTSTGTIRIWDAIKGQLHSTLAGHTGLITSIAFSPDLKSLASASDDFTVRLWDVLTGSERATFLEDQTSVNSVEFDLDGDRLVAGNATGEVTLWRAGRSTIGQLPRSELNSNDAQSAAGIGSHAEQAGFADQFDLAVELYQRADDRWRKLMVQFPHQVIYQQQRFYDRHSLARLWMRLKKFSDAEIFLRETIELERKAFSNGDRLLGGALGLLGECCLRQGRFVEAQEFLSESLTLCRELEPDTFVTHQKEYFYGLTYVGLKDFSVGKEILLQASAGLRRRQHVHSNAPQRILELKQFTMELYESLNASDQLPSDLHNR